jgi:hypothetical protein
MVEPNASPAAQGGGWTMDAWVKWNSDIARVIAAALQPPAGMSAFEYATGSLENELEQRLRAHGVVQGIAKVLLASIAKLKAQAAATPEELNGKFASDGSGSIELAYGDAEAFHSGLESSIGLPLMRDESAALQRVSSAFRGYITAGPTILGQMELEHTLSDDSAVSFPSQVCARAATFDESAHTPSPL